MLVIGLVGGIASGKSYVAECFEQMGAHVIHADKIGHQILELPDVVATIKTWWPNVVCENGLIDRKSLAAIVFPSDDNPSNGVSRSQSGQSHQALEKLESLMHPLIGQQIDLQLVRLRSDGATVAVLDAPVMFKAGWQTRCDKIVFVDCALDIRADRIGQRNWNADEITKRERFQTPTDQKRKRASHVINNSGSRESTFQQVELLWNRWVSSPTVTNTET